MCVQLGPPIDRIIRLSMCVLCELSGNSQSVCWQFAYVISSTGSREPAIRLNFIFDIDIIFK